MFFSLPKATANVVLENLAVHPTGLTTADTCYHASSGPPHPASSPAGSSEGGLRSIYVCNKALLWGKTHSDWLGLAPHVGGPMPSQANQAQSCEIHTLGPN